MERSTDVTGWCNDPFARHEHRWMSQGQPTDLVSDKGVEDKDPPPDGPFVTVPTLVEASEASNGEDLRRADEADPEDDNRRLRAQIMADFTRLNPF